MQDVNFEDNTTEANDGRMRGIKNADFGGWWLNFLQFAWFRTDRHAQTPRYYDESLLVD